MSEYFPPTMPDNAPPSNDNSWVRTAVGSLLVLLGVDLLLERATGRDIPLVLPALGLAFLAAWFRNQRRGFLIAGGIIVGWGTGLLFQSLLGHPFGFLAPLGLACGFLMIHRMSLHDESWARIAFMVAGVVALAELASAVGLSRTVGSALGTVAAPMALIILGGLVVARRALPRRTFAIGAAAAACFGLIALNASASELSFSLGFARTSRHVTASLPQLEDRTLVVEAGLGDVTVANGDLAASAEVTARGHNRRAAKARANAARFQMVQGDDTVTLSLVTSGHTGASYRVTVPAGAAVGVRAGAGDISAHLEDGSFTAESGSGDVDIAMTTPDRLVIRTGSGDVDLTVMGDPSVDVRTGSGDIDTDGFDDEPDWRDRLFTVRGVDGDVLITTGSGDVDVEREDAGRR